MGEDAASAHRSSRYEPVAEHETYQRINRWLVERADMAGRAVVVDLGGGTGAIAELVLERAPAATVWVVDPDEDMLADAQARLGDRTRFARAGAEEIGALFPPATVDAVLMGNCIHLVDDIVGSLAQINTVLGPSGRFAFNSAFHAGADAPEERHLYWEMLMTAKRILRRRGVQPVARSLRPLAKRPLTREFYESALAETGFTVEEVHHDVVTLEPELVLDIVGAPVFAEGALPGVAPEVATEVMREAVAEVADRREVRGVKRTWITMVATVKERVGRPS